MASELTLWFDDAERWQFRHGTVFGTGAAELAARLGFASAAEVDEDARPRVQLLLPAERVLTTQVRVPARTRRQLLRALPFAVEERLAIDLDGVHIAHAVPVPNTETPVCVVELAWFEAVLAYVKGLGLAVDAVHVDAAQLPLRDDVTLLVDGSRLLLRDAGRHCFACNRQALSFVLERACRAIRGDDDRPLSAHVYVVADAPLSASEQATIASALAAGGRAGSVRVEPLVAALPLLCAANDSAAIDLLQGRFALRRAIDINWKPWKPVAIAAAALLLLLPVLDAGKAWRFGREAERLDAESIALYRQLFPGESVPRDLRRSFESRLGEDDSAVLGFRPLLAALADTLRQARGFDLQSVSYQRERDELAVQVLAGSLSELEQFKSRFAAHRVVAEVSSAEQEDERIRARLRVHSSERATGEGS